MKPNQLIKAALDRKAVTGLIAASPKPVPAAFVVGMPFKYVMSMLPRLQMYKKRT